MRIKHLLLCLLAMLLAGVQRGLADDNQARIYIPSVEFSDDGKNGYSFVTPKNPYFTLYVWYQNEDHNDSYWSEAPKLTIDGREITLTNCYKHNKPNWKDLECKDSGGKTVYVVHYVRSFQVKDEDFSKTFPLKDFSNADQDYYHIFQILFTENWDGSDHKVSVYGKLDYDGSDNDGEGYAKGIDGEKEIKSGKTSAPFGNFLSVNKSLRWSNPGRLTFTSQNFEENSKDGQYQVILDGVESSKQKAGVIEVTKDYGTHANYQTKDSVNIQYKYYCSHKFDGSSSRDIVFLQNNKELPKSLPYPSNLSMKYDPWNQTIGLSWEMKNNNSTNYKGTIYILRDGVQVAKMGNSYSPSGSWEDSSVAYDTDYTYTVYFVPENWTDHSHSELLSVKAGARLNYTVDLGDLHGKALTDGYKLDWRLNTKMQTTLKQTSYQFKIYRLELSDDHPIASLSDFANLAPIATLQVSSSPADYSYTDHVVNSTSTYAYMVSLEAQGTTFYTNPPIVPDGYPDGSYVTGLYASRGTYTDHVRVSWESQVLGQDKMQYRLYRHLIEEGDNKVKTIDDARDKWNWDLIATIDATTESQLFYDDYEALPGYYYIYAVVAAVNGKEQPNTQKASDGFARSTGTVYGAVTYDNSKFAVQGVRVAMQASGTDGRSLFNSISLNGQEGGLFCQFDDARIQNYFRNRSFSVQLYVNPGEGQNGKCLFDICKTLRLSLSDSGDNYKLTASTGDKSFSSNLSIRPGQFTHVTFTYDAQEKQGWLHLMAPDSLGSIASEQLFSNVSLSWPDESGDFSVGTRTDSTQCLLGYVDEVRLFNRRLTQADVEQNFSHSMGGKESGLVAYWTFDEGISTMRRAYDYAQTNGTSSGNNHASLMSATRTHIELPTPDQLSIYAVTDTIGQYTIQGIPFTGEGTTYNIIPSKGVHSFQPKQRSVYVSPKTLNFDPQNFEDVSSFNVKGVVYYENTTYPVKGCRFRVDDTVVKDEFGKEVLSDEKGEFTIPVSIGEHVIYVEKEGHIFLNQGRYPAEGKLNVNDSISHLTFTDMTKVIVAGRIVGGSVERNKPLGMGLSKANIGAATLTLLTSSTREDSRRMNVVLDKEEGIFNPNSDTLFYELADSNLVNCVAYAGAAKDGDDQVKVITIKTNPKTGEFAVLLPPVPYYISTVVDNNKVASAAFSDQQLFDASNVLHTDTAYAMVDSIPTKFVYNASYQPAYYAEPQIDVVQVGNEDGAFGETRVPAGEQVDTVDVYTVEDGGVVHYNYGHPIFMGYKFYKFQISSFERYYNYDGDKDNPAIYEQPSNEGLLTFKNPMDLTADTLENVPLDSLGHYIYTFQALEPNVEPPYLQPIEITLALGENRYDWEWTNGDETGSLKGAVFSSALTGNSFVTKAPETVTNILRDPFGSNSYATWREEKVHNYGFKRQGTWCATYKAEKEKQTGVSVSEAKGAPGLYIYGNTDALVTRFSEYDLEVKLGTETEHTWSFTTKKSISTSSDKLYDGPDGDLYIGVSTSMTFGDGSEVKLVNQQDGTYAIGKEDVIVMGDKVDGTFIYSQYELEHQIIPNLKKLRQNRLVLVSPEQLDSCIANFVNPTDSVIYMTTLRPSDEHFGVRNDDSCWGEAGFLTWRSDSLCASGPSYTYFLPAQYKSDEEMWDAIAFYNTQIENWEGIIAENERGKVSTIGNAASLDKTYAFGAGTGQFVHESGESQSNNETGFFNIEPKHFWKFKFGTHTENGAKKGVDGAMEVSVSTLREPSLQFSQSNTKSYELVLDDPVYDNMHAIEVYNALDEYSPVIRQVGGQTSQNYEGEQVTRYFEPGVVFSEGTDQIEVPHIYCPEPTVTGVPQGQAAQFDLILSNATNCNLTQSVNFSLMMDDDRWGSLADVTFSNDDDHTGYDVSLDPNTEKYVTVKVKPTNNDIIHIDSLHLIFFSAGQSSIYDEIYLSAHFQPEAVPVQLAASRTLVNTGTDSTLVLNVSGYDPNSNILNAVRVQQRKQGAPEWSTIRTFVKGEPKDDTEAPLLADGVKELIDMHSGIFYPDGVYEFRAVTDCTVAGESVLGESDVAVVTKDVTLPQPIQLPEPADGVLSPGDNITLTFNEDIYSQSLNKADNFIIQSILNTDSIAHEVALRLDGSSKPVAVSQTPLTLGGTSWTACFWLKNQGEAGTVLRHGDGNDALRLNLDAAGHLTAFLRDEDGVAQPYTSAGVLPKDVWCYVGVVYDVIEGTLSAYYASGDNEGTLMSVVPVGKKVYGDGKIYLGEGLTGAMHELSLFSSALTWTTVKAQMYYGKSHSTPSLIGYWRLDEGHGTKSEDLARSRHMQLASASAWHLENENIALQLNASRAVAVPMGQLSVGNGISYLVEMWLKVDNGSQGAIFSLDRGKVIDLNVVGDKLQLVCDTVAYNVTSSSFTPDEWHHVAFNVMRTTGGQANVIVDGVSVLTVPSDKVPALAGARLWLGSGLSGSMDEVRIWHGVHTQQSVEDGMYTRLDGKHESGLVGYYPMETTYYDEYDQRIYELSLENKGFEATASTSLTYDDEAAVPAEAGNSPGLKVAPHKTNLDFNYVADERTVSVNLEHSPASLEDCSVTTTLRSYYDMHSNVGKPVTWSFVVKQNPLVWSSSDVAASIPAGQSGTFKAVLTNNGPADQPWSFADMPSWLTATPSSGTLVSHQSQEVVFTVRDGQGIGKYFTTVSARTDNGLDTPLDVLVKIEGDRPAWKPVLHSSSMSLVAQIQIDGIISTDPDDLLGIFAANAAGTLECVGVGSPAYVSSKDAFFVRTIVNGESGLTKKLFCQIYDAGTGQTYPLTEVTPELTFIEDELVGTLDDPVIVKNGDERLHTLELAQGWTWISTYLEPNHPGMDFFDPVVASVDSVLVSNKRVAKQTEGTWSLDVSPIRSGMMMKVASHESSVLPVIGLPVDPLAYPQTIHYGSNWVGVPTPDYMTLDEAFASISPEEGDQVKNEYGFSIFTDGKWEGAFNSVQPGRGYIYFSMSQEDKTLVFPPIQAGRAAVPRYESPLVLASRKYASNMVMLCAVRDGGELASGAAVEVYDEEGELRGRSIYQLHDTLYLVIASGDVDGEQFTVQARLADGRVVRHQQPIRYQTDGLLGLLHAPFIIGDNLVGMGLPADDTRILVATISGILLYEGPAADFDYSKVQPGQVVVVKEIETGRTSMKILK